MTWEASYFFENIYHKFCISILVFHHNISKISLDHTSDFSVYINGFLCNVCQVFSDHISIFSVLTHSSLRNNRSLFQAVIFYNTIRCCVKNTTINHTQSLNFLKCFFSLHFSICSSFLVLFFQP